MILSKYIIKTILSTVFVLVLVVIGVELVFEFTNEFSDIGTGNYGIKQVLLFVPLMLPQNIYQMAPLVGLLGGLIGLSLLASHSELVVMRTSGMSLKNLTWIALKSALFLVIIMILIGEVLAPIAQQKALAKKSEAMTRGQALITSHGLWLRNKNNFIHIDSVSRNGNLSSILRYQLDEQNKLKTASFAAAGKFEQGLWKFKNIDESEFKIDRIDNAHFAEQTWDLSLSPRLLGLTNINPEQKSLPELYQYIKYRAKSGLNVERYAYIFWQRVFHPLAIIVMVLLSVPFVFGFFKNKAIGIRILTGTVVGFSFYILTQFIGRFALVFHLPVAIAALAPVLLFTILLSVLFIKQKAKL